MNEKSRKAITTFIIALAVEWITAGLAKELYFGIFVAIPLVGALVVFFNSKPK